MRRTVPLSAVTFGVLQEVLDETVVEVAVGEIEHLLEEVVRLQRKNSVSRRFLDQHECPRCGATARREWARERRTNLCERIVEEDIALRELELVEVVLARHEDADVVGARKEPASPGRLLVRDGVTFRRELRVENLLGEKKRGQLQVD